jgi:glutaredoxin 3
MRCAEHGLVVGPSGECVLCLRRSRARAQRRAVQLSVGFCLAMLLLCGVVLSARRLGSATVPLAESSRSRVAPALAQSAPSERTAAPSASNDAAPELPLPSNAERAAAVSPVAARERGTSLASAVPSANSPSKVLAARVPSQREIEAAVHATPVLMFSTTWCPHCKRARRFFQANGIAVTDRDIEADAAAASEIKRRSGSKSVPLIDVDGEQLQGFDESSTLRAVASSVERRLGVSGLQIVPAVRN